MPHVERSSKAQLQGAYASGTVTHGLWMQWSPGQDFTKDTWYAEPVDNVSMFAGVVMERTQKRSSEPDGSIPSGDVVTLIKSGYAPKAYVKNPIGIADETELLPSGNIDGYVKGVVDTDEVTSALGTLLEDYIHANVAVRHKVIVRGMR